MSTVEKRGATRQRLLEAAEQLFSERGFEKVSVRDITELAGANVAAVNYHFRSREDLVEQVIERYIRPVSEERLARLDALEKKAGSKAVPLEEILDAFVRPFVTQVRRSELSEKLFYQLMGRIFGDKGAVCSPTMEASFAEIIRRFHGAFHRALPQLQEGELLWRIHFMIGSMIHTMAHAETLNRISGGIMGQPSMEQILSRFIHFAAAGMREGVEAPEKAKGPQGEFSF